MPAPRKLTDQDIADIREWHRQDCQFRQKRKTRRQMAREKGCSVHTIDDIIRNPGYRPNAEDKTITDEEFQRLVNIPT